MKKLWFIVFLFLLACTGSQQDSAQTERYVPVYEDYTYSVDVNGTEVPVTVRLLHHIHDTQGGGDTGCGDPAAMNYCPLCTYHNDDLCTYLAEP